MLGARERVAELYREALSGIEGLRLPCPDQGGNVRGWFVFVVQLPSGVERDIVIRRLADLRDPKQALPARDPPDELLSRAIWPPAGEFPVCEEVAVRSLALPFFPGLFEQQVVRVGEGLRAVLGR